MATCPRCQAEATDPAARFCAACGASLAGPDPAGPDADPTRRKTVTLLFSDLSGSTAMGERLDSESVREIMHRYFDLARIAIERHGGTVEKYVGDAVMAAFGIPTAREDDALRAVRAAAEIRDALEELNDELTERLGTGLRVRIGVNTGEVIAGDPSAGQAFATGDAVNVAARLEQAAPPGEVLLGERTHALVRDAVEVEATEPLELKGKSEPLPAYRLRTVSERAERGVARRLDAPIVGREAELAALDGALETAIGKQRGGLVLVLGEAGLGKSRLAGAFAAIASSIATVVEARCPSYGEGALYPFERALLALAGIEAADPPTAGYRKLEALAGAGEERMLELLAAFLGLSERQLELSDAAWAIHRLLRARAADRPLVLFVDDVHWADPVLLELAATLGSGERALLVVCLARPDLLEDPERATALEAAAAIRLAPLAGADEVQIARQVLGADPPPALAERVSERAGGNPLFVEELWRGLLEGGALVRRNGAFEAAGEVAEIALPDSVEALLGARVESLAPLARATLETAAIATDSVWAGAVAALQPERAAASVEAELDGLAERGFLVATASALAGERQFRFAHILMREAAYRLITKRRRARLHERLADWLEGRASGDLAFDAASGRHLALAHDYRAELGTEDPAELAELARRASDRLSRAGIAAIDDEDHRLASELLERAIGLAPSARERATALTDLAMARYFLGAPEAQIAAAEAAIEAASQAGDVEAEWVARLLRAVGLGHLDPERHEESIKTVARGAVAALAGTDAHYGLVGGWSTLVHSLLLEGDAAAALEAADRATDHARECRRRLSTRLAFEAELMVLIDGPADVARLARMAGEWAGGRGGAGPSLRVEGLALIGLGVARGAQGRLEEARERFRRGAEIFDELSPLDLATTLSYWGMVELWADDPEAAERVLRRGCARLDEGGVVEGIGLSGALLADALARQGRCQEAEAWAERAKATAAATRREVRVRWRSAAARGRAGGDREQAARLALEATGLADETDLTPLRADAWLARADVALAAQRWGDAAAAARRAEALYREKGIVVAAAQAVALAGRATR